MSFVVMLGQLIVSSLAAYAFVFIPFIVRYLIFMLFLSTMLIPLVATIIPNFITITNLDWIDTYKGLTIPFFALPFGIFLLRQHFLTIPKEIWESAQVEDRKSTRLNSSHVAISYAVFCLKKKIKKFTHD